MRAWDRERTSEHAGMPRGENEAVSPAQVAYYATAATVIPVLLLAYAVQTGTDVRERISKRWDNAISGIFAFGDDVVNRQDRHAIRRLLGVLSLAMASTIAQLVAFAVVGLPVLAEILAFRQLGLDKSSQGAVVLVAIGVAVSAVIALAPILFVAAGLVSLPYHVGWKLLKAEFKLISSLWSSSGTAPKRAEDAGATPEPQKEDAPPPEPLDPPPS